LRSRLVGIASHDVGGARFRRVAGDGRGQQRDLPAPVDLVFSVIYLLAFSYVLALLSIVPLGGK
jgi:hypothetical protein